MSNRAYLQWRREIRALREDSIVPAGTVESMALNGGPKEAVRWLSEKPRTFGEFMRAYPEAFGWASHKINTPRYLQGADFARCRLNKIHLDGCKLQGASFYRASLHSSNMSFADLRNANLERADLRYAILAKAKLKAANLRNADLRYANLRRANLKNADLRGADLRHACLHRAILAGANLDGARINWLRPGHPRRKLLNIRRACRSIEAFAEELGLDARPEYARSGSVYYKIYGRGPEQLFLRVSNHMPKFFESWEYSCDGLQGSVRGAKMAMLNFRRTSWRAVRRLRQARLAKQRRTK